MTDGGGETVPIAVFRRAVETGVDTVPVSQGAPVLQPAGRAHTHRVRGWLGGGGGGGCHGEAVTETEEPRHSVTLTVSRAPVEAGGGAVPVSQVTGNISNQYQYQDSNNRRSILTLSTQPSVWRKGRFLLMKDLLSCL